MINYTDEQLVSFVNKLENRMETARTGINKLIKDTPAAIEFYKTRSILEESKVLDHTCLLYFKHKRTNTISAPTVLLATAWNDYDITETECYPKELDKKTLQLIEQGEKILNSYAERMSAIAILDINKL